jgi:putative hemolysin
MKKSTVYLISFLIITLVAFIAIGLLLNKARKITSFSECAKYYAVQETYPARCVTPDGTVYIESTTTGTPTIGMANPAAVYCEKNGGKLTIIEEEPGMGGQVGMCTLPNGNTCEEWTYYRGECK